MTERQRLPSVDDRIVLRPWMLPVLAAGLSVPVIVGVALQGLALGAAVAALLVAIILVVAVRAGPREPFEIAARTGGGRRILVVATHELSPEDAEEIASRTAGAAEVRVLLPVPSSRLAQWLSATDEARATAEHQLAGSEALLTAAGARVSGAVGDSDPVQAVEDELRSYSADEVLLYGADGESPTAQELRRKLRRPLSALERR